LPTTRAWRTGKDVWQGATLIDYLPERAVSRRRAGGATMKSTWHPQTHLLRTTLKGVVTVEDVEAWRASLREALSTIPTGASFKLLFDLHGYEPATTDAHKAMRTVVPLLLAATGMRPAVIDLFPDPPHLDVAPAPAIRCVAYANVHHDAAKMAHYQATIAKPNQRFFSDLGAATHWLAEQPL
jgi:hypothetical protein